MVEGEVELLGVVEEEVEVPKEGELQELQLPAGTTIRLELAWNPYIYDYGSKAAADQMKTTTEQVILYAGSNFGEDISTEIRTRAKVTIPEVETPEEAQKKHELLHTC